MRLSAAKMFERFSAGDPAFDGRFFTGVQTTGIYCLPSCHARKPKRENVRFFSTIDAAQAAGFRACRKCHPDDFALGADPVLQSIETLVGEIRADPGRFKDVRAVVRRSGFGTTRVFELFRQHYHATPAEVLLRARLDRTKTELLTTDRPLAEVAAQGGFESMSVLHAHFKARCGLTPAAYRALRNSSRFTLTLPTGYPLAHLRRALSRDPQAVNERWTGDRYQVAVGTDPRRPTEVAVLSLDFAGAPQVQVEISRGNGIRAHALTAGILGLDQDATAFSRLAARVGLGRLVAGRPQLRITQTVSVFEGLLWAVIGQQINLPFAFALRRRLFELAGQPVIAANGDRLHAAPTPAAVAALSGAQLKAVQFSRQKADYLVSIAARIAAGTLDLEGLRSLSATRAESVLLGVRGLGPWSVNYIMMRSLGYADCLPLGDTGVTAALQHLFELDQRPDAETTRRLMSIFAPHRSLATAHLWQLLQSVP